MMFWCSFGATTDEDEKAIVSLKLRKDVFFCLERTLGFLTVKDLC